LIVETFLRGRHGWFGVEVAISSIALWEPKNH
jgi:hypothetical protein